jgi:thioredoxin-related protein
MAIEWSEILKMAQKENKLIFLDLYSTACKPCRIMAQEVLTDSLVGEYFNHPFIIMSYNFRTSESGRYLNEKFILKTYPTFYFIDQNENLINSISGIQTPDQLIYSGQKALEVN